MTKTLLLTVTSFLAIAAPVFGRGLTPEDLASLARLSDPEVSPNGSIVAFVLRETDQVANGRRADIWLIDLDDSEAGPRRLTDHKSNDIAPQWSADNDAVYFISSRSGSDQVWRIPTDGGEAAQVTDYPVDVANLRVAPGGDRIAFTANVFPDCDTLTCTEDRLKAEDKDNHSGMLHETLLVRHWDTWEDGRRSALFTAELDDDGVADGDPVEVSGDLDGDVPSVPFGGREEIAFSPDGSTLYFALREAGRTEAWSTNFDIFGVPADGSAAPENLTPGNDAVDTHPVVSPNGKTLVWAAMSRPRYEADQLDIMVRDLASGDTRNLTEDWDRSVGDIVFSPDGENLYVTAGDVGTTRIFRISVADGAVEPVTQGLSDSSLKIADDLLIYVRDSFAAPADLYSLPLNGEGARSARHTAAT